ncbi:MAG: DUF6659 family protein [Candidatus Nitrosomaritimum yanchengensis]
MNYSKLCSSILGLEPQIRGALVFHHSGELLGGGMREGIMSYLPKEEIAKTTLNSILRWKTRELLYPFLGKGKYSFTEYDKIKRITFPLTESIFLIVSTEVEVDHDVIIQKILQMINKH